MSTTTIQKHAGGRPTIYNPIFIQMADDYLATCGREQTKLPKLTEYYRFIGISKQCADEWKDKYPQFGDACKKIQELQQETLIDDGMYGGKEVNQAMAIFLLKANHGMVETSRTEVTGEHGGPIQYKIITGTGYIPAGVIIDATPEGSLTDGQSSVQDNRVAQESPKNNDSNL